MHRGKGKAGGVLDAIAALNNCVRGALIEQLWVGALKEFFGNGDHADVHRAAIG